MQETSAAVIEIEVACATARRQLLISLHVPAGSTALQAVTQSGVLSQFPEMDARPPCLGVFGRRVAPDQVLADGDRVELYRELSADPKQARRRRARR